MLSEGEKDVHIMKQERFLWFQYPLAQFLYWVTCCACSGFVAVYLQYKGLSNTYIGVIVGFYGVLSLLVQPLSSKIIGIIRGLTVRKMIILFLMLMSGMFAAITFFAVSDIWTITAFIVINAMNSCMIPLMNALGMEYVNQKQNVNFGLARGFGSLGWAVSAAVIGFLLEKFSPDILGYIYIISAGVMFLDIFFMPDFGQWMEPIKTEEKEKGVLGKCLKDSTLLFVIIGSFLNQICHALCTTYTINIVRGVGGNETAAGLAQFFGAGSEMLGMVLFGVLIARYGSIRVLKISSIFFALRFLFLIFAGNLPMVMFGYALQGPSAGLYIPAAVYLVNERMLPQNRMQGQTIYNVLTSGMANFMGNLLGGNLIDRFGLRATLVTCFILATVGCACIMTRKASEESYSG